MKRITYTSRLAPPFSEDVLESIGAASARSNRELGVTGVLVYFSGHFFQVIEGDEQAIDTLYDKIRKDRRHRDVLCLKAEHGIAARLFPEWSMNVINLDRNTDALIRPLRILLQTIAEAHTIIERYTQPAVLNILNRGVNPLTVPARKVERIILFADIVSFSTITECLPVEMIAEMLNRYLDIAGETVSASGGEITKFIGDCVMAYYDPNQADAAIQACLDILAELRQTREDAGPDSPLRLLHCGFGLSQGTVIEGNLGTARKIDYTVLGDAVNTASRLEALTRRVRKSIVLSEEVKKSTRRAWPLVSLGRHDLRGKEKTSEVYFLDHELVNAFDPAAAVSNGARRIGQTRR